MNSNNPTLAHMQTQTQQWQETADDKALFLRCYFMMTRNVLTAVNHHEFNDPIWVSNLLDLFANYYFVALSAYENDPASAPLVWQVAHNAAKNPTINAMQKLLLGVNAHINYDLVLTLVDMLEMEWESHTEEMRNGRYADHCHINQIIGSTIDAVQDEVLEPAMPILDSVDKLLGPLDEKIILHLITHWREKVWHNATTLLTIPDTQDRHIFIAKVEQEALQTGKYICNKQ
ncbi:MAG: hypothetical protein IAF02_25390 [Anaerolineae bacterium]|nr:hypothetical protein [Anaerolineae bacterium]